MYPYDDDADESAQDVPATDAPQFDIDQALAANSADLDQQPAPQQGPAPDFLASLRQFTGKQPHVAAAAHGIDMDTLLGAVSGQESGGHYHVVNKDSGALGKYQILPVHLRENDWAIKHLGRQVSPQEFLNNPQMQEQLAKAKLSEYVQKAVAGGADQDTAVRMAAAAWYGGEGAMKSYNSTRPQAGYPSIAGYTESVNNRYKAAWQAANQQAQQQAALTTQAPAMDPQASAFNEQLRALTGKASVPGAVAPAPAAKPPAWTSTRVEPETTRQRRRRVQSQKRGESGVLDTIGAAWDMFSQVTGIGGGSPVPTRKAVAQQQQATRQQVDEQEAYWRKLSSQFRAAGQHDLADQFESVADTAAASVRTPQPQTTEWTRTLHTVYALNDRLKQATSPESKAAIQQMLNDAEDHLKSQQQRLEHALTLQPRRGGVVKDSADADQQVATLDQHKGFMNALKDIVSLTPGYAEAQQAKRGERTYSDALKSLLYSGTADVVVNMLTGDIPIAIKALSNVAAVGGAANREFMDGYREKFGGPTSKPRNWMEQMGSTLLTMGLSNMAAEAGEGAKSLAQVYDEAIGRKSSVTAGGSDILHSLEHLGAVAQNPVESASAFIAGLTGVENIDPDGEAYMRMSARDRERFDADREYASFIPRNVGMLLPFLATQAAGPLAPALEVIIGGAQARAGALANRNPFATHKQYESDIDAAAAEGMVSMAAFMTGGRAFGAIGKYLGKTRSPMLAAFAEKIATAFGGASGAFGHGMFDDVINGKNPLNRAKADLAHVYNTLYGTVREGMSPEEIALAKSRKITGLEDQETHGLLEAALIPVFAHPTVEGFTGRRGVFVDESTGRAAIMGPTGRAEIVPLENLSPQQRAGAVSFSALREAGISSGFDRLFGPEGAQRPGFLDKSPIYGLNNDPVAAGPYRFTEAHVPDMQRVVTDPDQYKAELIKTAGDYKNYGEARSVIDALRDKPADALTKDEADRLKTAKDTVTALESDNASLADLTPDEAFKAARDSVARYKYVDIALQSPETAEQYAQNSGSRMARFDALQKEALDGVAKQESVVQQHAAIVKGHEKAVSDAQQVAAQAMGEVAKAQNAHGQAQLAQADAEGVAQVTEQSANQKLEAIQAAYMQADAAQRQKPQSALNRKTAREINAVKKAVLSAQARAMKAARNAETAAAAVDSATRAHKVQLDAIKQAEGKLVEAQNLYAHEENQLTQVRESTTKNLEAYEANKADVLTQANAAKDFADRLYKARDFVKEQAFTTDEGRSRFTAEIADGLEQRLAELGVKPQEGTDLRSIAEDNAKVLVALLEKASPLFDKLNQRSPLESRLRAAMTMLFGSDQLHQQIAPYYALRNLEAERAFNLQTPENATPEQVADTQAQRAKHAANVEALNTDNLGSGAFAYGQIYLPTLGVDPRTGEALPGTAELAKNTIMHEFIHAIDTSGLLTPHAQDSWDAWAKSYILSQKLNGNYDRLTAAHGDIPDAAMEREVKVEAFEATLLGMQPPDNMPQGAADTLKNLAQLFKTYYTGAIEAFRGVDNVDRQILLPKADEMHPGVRDFFAQALGNAAMDTGTFAQHPDTGDVTFQQPAAAGSRDFMAGAGGATVQVRFPQNDKLTRLLFDAGSQRLLGTDENVGQRRAKIKAIADILGISNQHAERLAQAAYTDYKHQALRHDPASGDLLLRNRLPMPERGDNPIEVELKDHARRLYNAVQGYTDADGARARRQAVIQYEKQVATALSRLRNRAVTDEEVDTYLRGSAPEQYWHDRAGRAQDPAEEAKYRAYADAARKAEDAKFGVVVAGDNAGTRPRPVPPSGAQQWAATDADGIAAAPYGKRRVWNVDEDEGTRTEINEYPKTYTKEARDKFENGIREHTSPDDGAFAAATRIILSNGEVRKAPSGIDNVIKWATGKPYDKALANNKRPGMGALVFVHPASGDGFGLRHTTVQIHGGIEYEQLRALDKYLTGKRRVDIEVIGDVNAFGGKRNAAASFDEWNGQAYRDTQDLVETHGRKLAAADEKAKAAYAKRKAAAAGPAEPPPPPTPEELRIVERDARFTTGRAPKRGKASSKDKANVLTRDAEAAAMEDLPGHLRAYYGTTTDPREAGFIHPDGDLIRTFRGVPEEMAYTHDQAVKKSGFTEAMSDRAGYDDQDYGGLSTALAQGAVRVRYRNNWRGIRDMIINFSQPLTGAQLRAISRAGVDTEVDSLYAAWYDPDTLNHGLVLANSRELMVDAKKFSRDVLSRGHIESALIDLAKRAKAAKAAEATATPAGSSDELLRAPGRGVKPETDEEHAKAAADPVAHLKDYYGTTTNTEEAGFIDKGGDMIATFRDQGGGRDFSFIHQSAVDDSGIKVHYQDLVTDHGAVRMRDYGGHLSFELGKPPSTKQIDTIIGESYNRPSMTVEYVAKDPDWGTNRTVAYTRLENAADGVKMEDAIRQVIRDGKAASQRKMAAGLLLAPGTTRGDALTAIERAKEQEDLGGAAFLTDDGRFLGYDGGTHEATIEKWGWPGSRYSFMRASGALRIANRANNPRGRLGPSADLELETARPMTESQLDRLLPVAHGKAVTVDVTSGSGKLLGTVTSRSLDETEAKRMNGEIKKLLPVRLADDDADQRKWDARTGIAESLANAKAYAASAGLKPPARLGYRLLPEHVSRRIADLMDEVKHDPQAPEVRKAYSALKAETAAQFRFLQGRGITFEPWTGEGQPYKNSAEMVDDVRKNRHLSFFTGGDMPVDHPLAADSGIEIGGIPLTYNDVFRAVHDYFGHSTDDFQFGSRGEYNATRAHAQLYSKDARPAMLAETLAQNSWVNFGKHLRTGEGGTIPVKGETGYVAATERPYAEQKAFISPELNGILPKYDAETPLLAPRPAIDTLPKLTRDEQRELQFPAGIYGTDYSKTVEQEITSEKTSRPHQNPALYSKVKDEHLQGVQRVFEIGAGKTPYGKETLLKRGVQEVLATDPFNRPADENAAAALAAERNPVDAAFMANVLNVIPDKQARIDALRSARRYVKDGGSLFIGVHNAENAKPKKTTDGWQMSKPLSWYIPEVREAFPNSTVEQYGGTKGYLKVTVDRPTGNKVPPAYGTKGGYRVEKGRLITPNGESLKVRPDGTVEMPLRAVQPRRPKPDDPTVGTDAEGKRWQLLGELAQRDAVAEAAHRLTALRIDDEVGQKNRLSAIAQGFQTLMGKVYKSPNRVPKITVKKGEEPNYDLPAFVTYASEAMQRGRDRAKTEILDFVKSHAVADVVRGSFDWYKASIDDALRSLHGTGVREFAGLEVNADGTYKDPKEVKLFRTILAMHSAGSAPDVNAEAAILQYADWRRLRLDAGRDDIPIPMLDTSKWSIEQDKSDGKRYERREKNRPGYRPDLNQVLLRPGLGYSRLGHENTAFMNQLAKRFGGYHNVVDWLTTPHPEAEVRAVFDEKPKRGLNPADPDAAAAAEGNSWHADTFRGVLNPETGEYHYDDSVVHDGQVLGAYIFGPKIGAFISNLNGLSGELTPDLWWTRTWNRWQGTLMYPLKSGKRPWLPTGESADERKLPESAWTGVSEMPRNNHERKVMRDTVREIAGDWSNMADPAHADYDKEFVDGLGIDPGHKFAVSEVQSMLWYMEQQYYAQQGHDGAKSRSYDQQAKYMGENWDTIGPQRQAAHDVFVNLLPTIDTNKYAEDFHQFTNVKNAPARAASALLGLQAKQLIDGTPVTGEVMPEAVAAARRYQELRGAALEAGTQRVVMPGSRKGRVSTGAEKLAAGEGPLMAPAAKGRSHTKALLKQFGEESLDGNFANIGLIGPGGERIALFRDQHKSTVLGSVGTHEQVIGDADINANLLDVQREGTVRVRFANGNNARSKVLYVETIHAPNREQVEQLINMGRRADRIVLDVNAMNGSQLGYGETGDTSAAGIETALRDVTRMVEEHGQGRVIPREEWDALQPSTPMGELQYQRNGDYVDPLAAPKPATPEQKAERKRERELLSSELNAILQSGGKLPIDELVRMIGERPDYLADVAEYSLRQRNRLREGRVTPRAVAINYIMTLASMGATEQPHSTVAGHVEKRGLPADLHPDAVTGKMAEIGLTAKDFMTVKANKAQQYQRPEDFVAKWLSTDEGQDFLDQIEAGNVDIRRLAQVRTPFGSPSTTVNRAGEVPTGKKGNRYSLMNLHDLTAEINKAGLARDDAKLLEIFNDIRGIKTGKQGFFGQGIGFGALPTVDAVELNIMLRGTARASSGDRLLQYAKKPNKTDRERLGEFVNMKLREIARIPEIRKQLTDAELDEEGLGAMMHHMLWDAAKGTQTTHKGSYGLIEDANILKAARGGRGGGAQVPDPFAGVPEEDAQAMARTRTKASLYKRTLNAVANYTRGNLLGNVATSSTNVTTNIARSVQREGATVPSNVLDMLSSTLSGIRTQQLDVKGALASVLQTFKGDLYTEPDANGRVDYLPTFKKGGIGLAIQRFWNEDPHNPQERDVRAQGKSAEQLAAERKVLARVKRMFNDPENADLPLIPRTAINLAQGWANVAYGVMGAEDAFAFTYHYQRTLRQLAKAQAMNERKFGGESDWRTRATEILQDPHDHLLDMAQAEAAVYTFQNSTRPHELIAALKGQTNRWNGVLGPLTHTALEMMVPFSKTPSSIIVQGLDLIGGDAVRVLGSDLPKFIGALRAGKHKAIDTLPEVMAIQRQMTNRGGNALVGGAMWTGIILGAMGVFSKYPVVQPLVGEDEKDKSKNFMLDKEGLGYRGGRMVIDPTVLRINQPAFTVDLTNAGPLGNFLLTAFAAGNDLRENGYSLKGQGGAALVQAGRAMAEYPLVKAVVDANEIAGSEYKAKRYEASMAGRFVPASALLSGIARQHDPYERQADTVGDMLKAGIPGKREQLPPKIDDLTGQPQDRKSVAPLYLPFNPQRYRGEDPTLKAVAHLGLRFPKPEKRKGEDDATYAARTARYKEAWRQYLPNELGKYGDSIYDAKDEGSIKRIHDEIQSAITKAINKDLKDEFPNPHPRKRDADAAGGYKPFRPRKF